MKLSKSNDGKHKWVAEFKNGKRTKFGALGMDDYTKTRNKTQRSRYRARHKKDLATHDPTRAGLLSYYLLWGNSPSIKANKRIYEKRFHV
jgi:hypothetical protein